MLSVVKFLSQGVQEVLCHEVDVKSMLEEQFEFCFRWKSYPDFLRLLEAFELPSVVCDNGTNVTLEHALLVVLRRLAFPNRLGDPNGNALTRPQSTFADL